MKNFFIFLLIVALIGGVGYYIITNTDTNLAIWQGYSSFGSFSKAADMDEFLGRPLDEGSFRALMALAFMGSAFSSDINFDIVSGSKLTERYGVSQSLRRDYNYLVKRNGIKGTTSYIAYFNGEVWLVLRYKEE